MLSLTMLYCVFVCYLHISFLFVLLFMLLFWMFMLLMLIGVLLCKYFHQGVAFIFNRYFTNIFCLPNPQKITKGKFETNPIYCLITYCRRPLLSGLLVYLILLGFGSIYVKVWVRASNLFRYVFNYFIEPSSHLMLIVSC